MLPQMYMTIQNKVLGKYSLDKSLGIVLQTRLDICCQNTASSDKTYFNTEFTQCNRGLDLQIAAM